MGAEKRQNWFFSAARYKIYLVAASLRIILLGFFGESWDIYVFIETAKQFVDQGLTPYQVALTKPPYIFMPYYPFIENWFAYPPLMVLVFSFFYLIAKILGLDSQFFVRFFIKLPLSLSDLLLAYMVHLILDYYQIDERKKRHAELLILFNPFIILLSTVWGMFDGLVMTMILISVYFMIREDFFKSALFISIAALAKQTALFFAPILFAYWVKKRGILRAVFYSLISIILFLAISLPFYLSSPKGFMQQVFLMHMSRPPWGYNIYTVAYYIVVFLATPIVALNEQALILLIDLISSIALSLFIVSIIFLASKAYSDTEGNNVIVYGLLTYLSFVFLNKVTNEPYFIYSLVFLLLYAFIYDKKDLVKLYTNFSYSLFIATLIAAVRFVIFLPSDILIFLVGEDIAKALWEMAPYYGESGPLIVATLFIAALIVLPELLNLFKFYLGRMSPLLKEDIVSLLYKPAKTPHRHLTKKIHKFLNNAYVSMKKATNFKSLVAILTILLLFYHLSYISPTDFLINSNEDRVQQQWPVIAIHYTWMSNPTHDPNIRDGDWIHSYLTPIEGFYESKASYMERDLELIKEAGFTAIIIEIHPGKIQKASVLAIKARDMEMNQAPYIDLEKIFSLSYLSNMNPDLGNGTTIERFYALKATSLSQILNVIYESSSLFDFPNSLLLDGNYTIFIDGVHLVLPSFDRESIGYQIETMFYYFNIPNFNTTELYEKLSDRWGVEIRSLDDIYAVYPRNITEFLKRKDTIASDARLIFKYSFKRFWKDILDKTKQLLTNVTIIAGIGNDKFNLLNENSFYELFGTVFYSKHHFKTMTSKITKEEELVEILKGFNSKKLVKVSFFYVRNTSKGLKTYEYTYRNSLLSNINESSERENIIFIFSWNDYLNGFVIEPTKELGYEPLNITKETINMGKSAKGTELTSISIYIARRRKIWGK